jgi:hypothetical protein
MTEADRLDQKINELKQWQTVAWRRIADPRLTRFEGREIRNHLRESELPLRYYSALVLNRLSTSATVSQNSTTEGMLKPRSNEHPWRGSLRMYWRCSPAVTVRHVPTTPRAMVEFEQGPRPGGT